MNYANRSLPVNEVKPQRALPDMSAILDDQDDDLEVMQEAAAMELARQKNAPRRMRAWY